MLRIDQAPGVYVEWLDRSAQQLDVGRTDVAGFVGFAPRGPVQTPTKIDSVQQFFSLFGGVRTDVISDAYLGYAVIGFFENGGRTCWVVRAANPAGAARARRRIGIPGRAPMELEAASPGEWGNSVMIEGRWSGDRISDIIVRAPERPVQLIPLDDPSTAPRIRTNLLGVAEATLPDARGVPLVQVAEHPDPTAPVDDLGAAAGPLNLVGGRDGTNDATLDHLIGDGLHDWGVTALERVDGVSFVAVPDLMAPSPAAPGTLERRFDDDQLLDAQLALINSCLRCGDRVAILDLPPKGEDKVLAYRTKLPGGDHAAAAVAATYHPWIAVGDPLRVAGLVRFIPPSGHVAGMFARTDRLRGVHTPPANEVIEGAYDLLDPVDAAVHGRLNTAGINAIRLVPGRGALVLGARTLSNDVRWRYVNVRRLFSMIEEALEEQMQWAVFEPNSPRLWRHLDRAVRGFLERLYRAGMLDGETSDEAYYVRCDGTTNPPEQTDAARVTCVLGIQPPYPAEFVTVRIGVTRSGIEIEEKGAQDV